MHNSANGSTNGQAAPAGGGPLPEPFLSAEREASATGQGELRATSTGASSASTVWAHTAGAAPSIRLSQPLLILGAGGSGCRVATQTKAILIERFGRMPENARILVFDSADERVTYRENRTGSMVSLEPGSEFHLLRRVPLAGIKRNLKQHPELAERIGANNLMRIPRLSIHDGAAQERPQGLIALAWNMKSVDQVLETTLRRLVVRNEDPRHGYSHQSGVNCVIVASTAGGQGSGATLDLAYLLRERLHALGDLAESSRIAALLLLPGAFPGLRGPNLLPNTYAFFRELDELMQGRGFDARYSGGLHLHSMEQPFDQVFVFDGVDEHGQAWANQDEIADLAARTLTLLFGSSVGLREIADAINERGTLSARSSAGFGTYLATAGQTALRFPRQQVAERCAIRQAQLLIVDLLVAPGEDAVPSPDALVNLGAVRDRLRTNRDGAPMQVRLNMPPSLEQARPEEAPALARNLTYNFQQRRIFQEVYGQLAEASKDAAGRLKQQLAYQLESLLSVGQLLSATQWLQAAERQLEKQEVALAGQVSQGTTAVELAQSAQDAAARILDQAADSLFLFRRGQVQKALAAYLDESNRLFQARLELRMYKLTREAGRTLWSWVQEQLGALQEAAARLEQARTALEVRGIELARRNSSRRELSLVTPELLAHLFAQYAGARASEVQQALQLAGGPLEWAGLTPEALGAALVRVTGQAFAPVRNLTVEDILALHWDNRSDQQWLAQLRSLAAGAWNLDRALLPGGGADLASFLTLGVPDESRSIFANSGHTLVSTNDHERVIALSTTYGAAFDMLRPTQRWREEYDKAAQRTPIHILPQFLQSEDGGLQVFALGIIFGCINSVATWFYYRSEDALAAPARLGQGLDKAIAGLAGQPELQAAIMERIEARIAADGTAKALDAIDAYVAADNTNGDETARNLRRAARAYGDELRRSLGAVRR